VPIAIISYPILFSSFFGAGGNGAMDILSNPNSAPFDNSQEVALDIYNPHQAVEPTVPELGMLILGAAVYITQTSKGDDRSPCHPSSTRVDNCGVPTLPADAKFGLVQIARAGMVLIRESGCN
jgi:hypothetical protein